MANNYEVPEMVDIGSASELILGFVKTIPIFDESVNQPKAFLDVMSDDE